MVQAMIYSLGKKDDVKIIKHNSDNNVIAEYKGKIYTAIYNVFTGMYYVDDVYGEIKN